MKNSIVLSLSFVVIIGCTGLKMDYADPIVQILAEDLADKGSPYIGKKISVRGIVKSVDTTNPKSVWVTLEGNIRCNFGDFLAMAQSYKIGEVITVDGFLEDLSENQTVIEPALGRDPLAPFRPLK